MLIKMTHEALAKAAKSVAGSLSKDKLSPWRFVKRHQKRKMFKALERKAS